MKNWFITFLTEKGFYRSEDSDLLLEGAVDKDVHIGLTLEMAVDFIVSTPHAQAIKTNFVKLDFANADCLDYWKHITNAFMMEMGYEEQYQVKHAQKA